MNIAFSVLAAVASLLLIPAVASAASGMPREQRLLVQVKHHASRTLPPVRSPIWTTPNLRTGSGNWRYHNYENYGASPGQPGSRTYAPYAGLPPVRYHY